MTPQGPYDDLIELPRPPSRYPKMPHSERAARFSPFAALSGHAAAVSEAARHTEERPIPEADAAECLDACLRYVLGSAGRTARFTWFVPDCILRRVVRRVEGFLRLSTNEGPRRRCRGPFC